MGGASTMGRKHRVAGGNSAAKLWAEPGGVGGGAAAQWFSPSSPEVKGICLWAGMSAENKPQ